MPPLRVNAGGRPAPAIAGGRMPPLRSRPEVFDQGAALNLAGAGALEDVRCVQDDFFGGGAGRRVADGRVIAAALAGQDDRFRDWLA